VLTEQDKINLADLIEREPPSNILQAMLSLAGRESTRIGGVNAQMTSETPLPVQRQVATALIAAERRVAVLRVAVQEATAKELVFGVLHLPAVDPGAAQMALL
jgi:hypothetical protein